MTTSISSRLPTLIFVALVSMVVKSGAAARAQPVRTRLDQARVALRGNDNQFLQDAELLTQYQVLRSERCTREEDRAEQDDDNAHDAHHGPSVGGLQGNIVVGLAGTREARKPFAIKEDEVLRDRGN